MKMSSDGAEVYILDYSQQSLKLVRSFMKENLATLLLADARTCPFPAESFDIVFHQGLLEHFSTPYPLLKENYRVLKKNGLLVVDVPQTFHIYTLIKHALIFINKWFGGWERQFTIQSLCKLLMETGFQPVHKYGDWSRPGMFYKVIRTGLNKLGIELPMMPRYFGRLTEKFYHVQERFRKKRLFLYTVLSIGIIARKR
jgi:SAM-dependent methyltransferase